MRKLLCKLGFHKWESVSSEELAPGKPFWVAAQLQWFPEYVVCHYCGKIEE